MRHGVIVITEDTLDNLCDETLAVASSSSPDEELLVFLATVECHRKGLEDIGGQSTEGIWREGNVSLLLKDGADGIDEFLTSLWEAFGRVGIARIEADVILWLNEPSRPSIQVIDHIREGYEMPLLVHFFIQLVVIEARGEEGNHSITEALITNLALELEETREFLHHRLSLLLIRLRDVNLALVFLYHLGECMPDVRQEAVGLLLIDLPDVVGEQLKPSEFLIVEVSIWLEIEEEPSDLSVRGVLYQVPEVSALEGQLHIEVKVVLREPFPEEDLGEVGLAEHPPFLLDPRRRLGILPVFGLL